MVGPAWPLRISVFVLGVTNGAFAVAAIGSMMDLASSGQRSREGVRMGLWGAAQAIAFGLGGFAGTAASDVARYLVDSPSSAYALVFAGEATLFLIAAILAIQVDRRGAHASRRAFPPLGSLPAPAGDRRVTMTSTLETFDAVVVGGGPAGATAAADLARRGHSVLLLDRAGRIKPCGGAIPPRLIHEFEIPDALLVARATSARMISPSDRHVDMPINGFVGMVDREVFDEWLRERAAAFGAERRDGTFKRLARDTDGTAVVEYRPKATKDPQRIRARVVIGADGALSAVARQTHSRRRSDALRLRLS